MPCQTPIGVRVSKSTLCIFSPGLIRIQAPKGEIWELKYCASFRAASPVWPLGACFPSPGGHLQCPWDAIQGLRWVAEDAVIDTLRTGVCIPCKAWGSFLQKEFDQPKCVVVTDAPRGGRAMISSSLLTLSLPAPCSNYNKKLFPNEWSCSTFQKSESCSLLSSLHCIQVKIKWHRGMSSRVAGTAG